MIRTLGRNGPKIIQVEITVPPAVYEPTDTELSLQQLKDDLNELQTHIAQKKGLDGAMWDNVKDLLKKGGKVLTKVKDKIKDVARPAQVELPQKMYEELETIIQILLALVDAMHNANSQSTDPDPASTSTESTSGDKTIQDENAAPSMVYVIRRNCT